MTSSMISRIIKWHMKDGFSVFKNTWESNFIKKFTFIFMFSILSKDYRIIGIEEIMRLNNC